MYRTCLFCLSPLGANRTVEGFPTGQTLAFDATRGRLWVVCPSCGRWNLSPLEERRAPIDALERLWSSASRRVQREGAGMAEVGDVRIVRVGNAEADEVAAWRYGRELRGSAPPTLAQRMRRTLRSLTVGTAFAPAARARHQTLLEVRDERGRRVPIRSSDLDGAEFMLSPTDDRLRVRLPRLRVRASGDAWAQLESDEAATLLDRILVSVNEEGATPNTLDAAVRFLARRGAERLLRRLGDDDVEAPDARLRIRYHGEGAWRGEYAREAGAHFLPLPKYRTLALEMALQQEAERRALEGELSALASRWREAEELAGIADTL